MRLVKTFRRVLGALVLNEDALYEVGVDRRETWPAVLLFALAGLAAGLSWIRTNSTWQVALPAWIFSCIIALGLIAEAAHFSALFLFGGGVRRDEIVRLAGFSMVPMSLAAFPYLGVISFVWAFAIFFKGMQTYFAMGPARTLTLQLISIGFAFVFWALANTVVVAILQPG